MYCRILTARYRPGIARAWGKSRGPLDHKHRMETVRPYRFKDAATLLVDFWTEVDKVLIEKGVVR